MFKLISKLKDAFTKETIDHPIDITPRPVNPIKGLNCLIPDPTDELTKLAAEDGLFIVAASYPGGVIVANSKGSTKLDGTNLPLGEKFNIQTMTKGEFIKSRKPKSAFRKSQKIKRKSK